MGDNYVNDKSKELCHMSTRAEKWIHDWFVERAKEDERSLAKLMIVAMKEYIKNKQEK